MRDRAGNAYAPALTDLLCNGLTAALQDRAVSPVISPDGRPAVRNHLARSPLGGFPRGCGRTQVPPFIEPIWDLCQKV